MHRALQILAWLVALPGLLRVLEALRGLPTIPNLLLPQHDLTPTGDPTLTVIVPARNEQKDIAACLQSLLAQDYPHVEIIAVNDRSTDRTAEIMHSFAHTQPAPRLRVIDITELPPNFLGKTHAMALAASQSTADFLLFTDADIFFRPDALRRALAHAVATRADHLVLAPTTLIRRWDEAALLAFFQTFGLWAARPWKVADPKARDAIGIGAFNLIRRSAYEQIGGFEALRMEIIEDLGLARRVKRFGLRQRIAFGRGLVNVHWASGVPGLINVMTKNIFSAFRYSVPLLLLGCLWIALFAILPFATVFYRPLTLPSALIIASMFLAYSLMAPITGLRRWNAFLAPFAAALFIVTLLRSMLTTLRQGGVIWRGTFYPLAELRRAIPPLRGLF